MNLSMPIIALLLLNCATFEAAQADGYKPEVLPSLHKQCPNLLMNIGISGRPFNQLPNGVEANPPQAVDAITYLIDPHVARIKVANDSAYKQTYKSDDGQIHDPIRAEFSTLRASETFYGEGDERLYRIAVRLDPSWPWDDSPAIFTQFKRTGAGPDLFLAVKRQSIVLRIGRPGAPGSSENQIISNVERGQWVEMLLRVRWSVGPQGQTVAFYRYGQQPDYTLAATIGGPNMQSLSKSKSYVKFGIYKPGGFLDGQPTQLPQILDIGDVAIFAPKR